jgi:hypothetical protein
MAMHIFSLPVDAFVLLGSARNSQRQKTGKGGDRGKRRSGVRRKTEKQD